MSDFTAPHKGRITVQSFFGPRVVDGRPGFHPGIDITGDDPTGPLYSMHSGTVVAQWSYQPDDQGRRAQNILVVSDDGTGILYSGLSELPKEDQIPAGSRIAAGDQIGIAGNTDHGKYHTHIEVVTPQGVARMGLARGQDAEGKSVWLFNGKSVGDATNENVGHQYSKATRTGLPNNIRGDAYRLDALIPGDVVVPWTQVSPNASAQSPQSFKWSPETLRAASQLHPYLAETPQANELIGRANPLDHPVLSPADIDRIYAGIRPRSDPLALPENRFPNSAPVVRPDANVFPGTDADWQAHFGQFPNNYVPNAPAPNASAPWYASPSNFAPLRRPGDVSPPVLRGPAQKRSAAPDLNRNANASPSSAVSDDIRRLSRKIYSQSSTSASDASVPQAPLNPPDDANSAAGPTGIVSGQPMAQWANQLPLADLIGISKASGGSDWSNLLAGLVSPNPTQPGPPQQTADSSAPVRVLSRRILNQTPTPAFDPGAPAAPPVDPDFSGGVLGRYAMGIDPQILMQPAPSSDDDDEQANLRALKARLSSSGNIMDALALYNARRSSWG